MCLDYPKFKSGETWPSIYPFKLSQRPDSPIFPEEKYDIEKWFCRAEQQTPASLGASCNPQHNYTPPEPPHPLLQGKRFPDLDLGQSEHITLEKGFNTHFQVFLAFQTSLPLLHLPSLDWKLWAPLPRRPLNKRKQKRQRDGRQWEKFSATSEGFIRLTKKTSSISFLLTLTGLIRVQHKSQANLLALTGGGRGGWFPGSLQLLANCLIPQKVISLDWFSFLSMPNQSSASGADGSELSSSTRSAAAASPIPPPPPHPPEPVLPPHHGNPPSQQQFLN